MKKHIIIYAAAIAPLAFFSCSKEKIETKQPDPTLNEIAFRPVPKPNLDSGIVGRYEFDGNLKEQSALLGDAVSNIAGADNYTDDRRGAPNSAIKFNGRYGLDIFKVPLSIKMSATAWVKYDSTTALTNYFVIADWLSPDFAQKNDTYWGIINGSNNTSGVPSGSIDNQWHLLAATYDGTNLNFYVDGSFVGSSVNKYTGNPYPQGATVHYQAGYRTAFLGNVPLSVWHGTLDDLRFYNRVLSAPDVKALYYQ